MLIKLLLFDLLLIQKVFKFESYKKNKNKSNLCIEINFFNYIKNLR